jgi:hypothetical protein
MLFSQPLEKVNLCAVPFLQHILVLLLATFGRRGHRCICKRLCTPAGLPLLMTWWITAKLDVGAVRHAVALEKALRAKLKIS